MMCTVILMTVFTWPAGDHTPPLKPTSFTQGYWLQSGDCASNCNQIMATRAIMQFEGEGSYADGTKWERESDRVSLTKPLHVPLRRT
jgi:hypothetical protein